MQRRILAITLGVCVVISGCSQSGTIRSKGPAPSANESADSSSVPTDGQSVDEIPSQPSETFPDLENIPLPDLGDLDACLELTSQLALLQLSGVGDDTSVDIDKIEQQIKELVPEDLRDEVEVIADGAREMKDEGIIKAGTVMNRKEFVQASEALYNYATTSCQAGTP
ncbi:MAG TPA: hypothetical protein DEG43_00025 [Acidimicrobiaceae bacterium]|jgi:hypothetical protein|nr:hypothetical protein [Acidimicrobiaceae bacterium]